MGNSIKLTKFPLPFTREIETSFLLHRNNLHKPCPFFKKCGSNHNIQFIILHTNRQNISDTLFLAHYSQMIYSNPLKNVFLFFPFVLFGHNFGPRQYWRGSMRLSVSSACALLGLQKAPRYNEFPRGQIHSPWLGDMVVYIPQSGTMNLVSEVIRACYLYNNVKRYTVFRHDKYYWLFSKIKLSIAKIHEIYYKLK